MTLVTVIFDFMRILGVIHLLFPVIFTFYKQPLYYTHKDIPIDIIKGVITEAITPLININYTELVKWEEIIHPRRHTQ